MITNGLIKWSQEITKVIYDSNIFGNTADKHF